jgi:hypothetical protein
MEPVPIVGKDFPTLVAAAHHMIPPAGHFNSQGARHDA